MELEQSQHYSQVNAEGFVSAKLDLYLCLEFATYHHLFINLVFFVEI